MNKTEIVTDFCCWEGKIANLIGKKVNEYYGVDFSEHSNSFEKEPASDLLNTI